jgi:cytochrome oxidase Cu insertion factor (SCO1/SenC/PrrC family)
MLRSKNVLLVTVFATLAAWLSASSVGAVEVGQKAPDFELTSTQGGKLRLSSLKGKNVLVNFYTLDFSPT